MTPTQADADTLYRRLEDGYAKIEQAEQERRDKVFLEDFWLSLLREYQAVCDDLTRIKEQEANRAEQKGLL